MANTRSRASAKAGDLGMMEAIQIVRLRHLLAAETSPAKKFVQQYYNDPVAFVHDCFRWPEGQGPTTYQEEILSAVVEHKRACIRGPHGLGKCLGVDEDMLLADGRYAKAKELIGRYFAVMSMDNTGKLVPALAYAFDNGVQPVFRIKTRYGRELVRTGNHPLLTFEGWKTVAELQPGDPIAMPSILPVEGQRPMNPTEIKMLAYLIGDGDIGGPSAKFTQQDGVVLDEMRQCVKEVGCVFRPCGVYGYAIVAEENAGKGFGGSSARNPVNELLRTHGVIGKRSGDKFVPAAIFELPNEQVALFLSRLFATDGWAHSSDDGQHLEIGYTSISRQLVVDIQRLLLRFGIVGRVSRRRTVWVHKGERKTSWAWGWMIHDSEMVLRFAKHVGIFGKEVAVGHCVRVAEQRFDVKGAHTQAYQRWPQAALGYVLDRAKEKGILAATVRDAMGLASRSRVGPKITTVRVKAAADMLNDSWLNKLLNANVGWDEVESIEPLGDHPTVGIAVPGYENYVGDLFEHNTSLSAWLILWFSITRDAAERDWKIPTTASAWRQLTKFLWPEVSKWARRVAWEKVGREPFSPRTEHLTMSLKLRYGEAFAAASDTPEYLEGAHADSLLYIFDESKAIPPETFDAAEGAFAGAGSDTINEAFAFAVSTPGEPQGRFYEIQSRQPGFASWWCRHVQLSECVAASRVSQDWVEERALQWGRESAIFYNRCLGEFHAADEDGVIPLGWIEQAIARAQEAADTKRGRSTSRTVVV